VQIVQYNPTRHDRFGGELWRQFPLAGAIGRDVDDAVSGSPAWANMLENPSAPDAPLRYFISSGHMWPRKPTWFWPTWSGVDEPMKCVVDSWRLFLPNEAGRVFGLCLGRLAEPMPFVASGFQLPGLHYDPAFRSMVCIGGSRNGNKAGMRMGIRTAGGVSAFLMGGRIPALEMPTPRIGRRDDCVCAEIYDSGGAIMDMDLTMGGCNELVAIWTTPSAATLVAPHAAAILEAMESD